MTSVYCIFPGEGEYTLMFNWQSDRDQYLFLAFDARESVEIALTDTHRHRNDDGV